MTLTVLITVGLVASACMFTVAGYLWGYAVAMRRVGESAQELLNYINKRT